MEHPSDAKTAFDKTTMAMAMVEVFAAKVTQLELRVQALEREVRERKAAVEESREAYLQHMKLRKPWELIIQQPV